MRAWLRGRSARSTASSASAHHSLRSCSHGSSASTTSGARAGSTRSSTGSARATSCAGGAVSVDGISGNAVGITRSGELAIDVDGERRLVEAGEVTYER